MVEGAFSGRSERALLPAREWPDGLSGRQLLRPHREEFAALDLLDQHLVLVLVGIALVVGELDRAVEGVPTAALEGGPELLAVAAGLGRFLREDPHRGVCGRRVVAGALAVF